MPHFRLHQIVGSLAVRFAQNVWIMMIGCVVLATHIATFGQTSSVGQWQTLSNAMPINPIHAALMRNGKIFVVAGDGYNPNSHIFLAAVFDPIAGTTVSQNIPQDLFCNAMVTAPDGRPIVAGGTSGGVYGKGIVQSSLFSPSTAVLAAVQSMAHGRWYPTATTLSDGRVMLFSGGDENGATNNAVELYTPCSGWSQQYVASFTPPFYPRMHLLPDGTVFNSAPNQATYIFNPSNQIWTTGPQSNCCTRTYGTSVLFPLTPANNYAAKVMIMGGGPFSGGAASTAKTEILDFSAPSPAWVYGPQMSQPRVEQQATILPSGKILVYGGSANNENADPSPSVDMYDPVSNAFTRVAGNSYFHLYHATGLLLPDARVVLMGSNPGPQDGSFENHIEIYSPPFLFNTDGSLATRPTISAVPVGAIAYGATFQVQTPDAGNIRSVALIRPGNVTHSFDMEQRMVNLSFTTGTGVLNITAPPNGAVAPPGYYMLFLINSSGVPSVAQFVQLLTTTTLGSCFTYLASYIPSSGPGHTLYVDPANHPIDATVNSSGPAQMQDLASTSSAATAAPGSLLTTWAQSDGQHVIYVNANQHLEQIWSTTNSQDMTAVFGFPSVAPGTSLTSWVQSDGPHVIYVNSNQHLQQIWGGSPTTSWNTQDMTAVFGFPGIAPGTPLTSWVESSGPRFVYVNSNQHLQLSWYTGNWNTQDLTALVGLPAIAAATSLTSWVQSDGPHFVYINAAQDLQQVWYDMAKGQWYTQDLTTTTGSTPAAIGSALATFGNYAVVYQGTNQHIFENWWSGSAWNSADATSASGSNVMPRVSSAITAFVDSTGSHIVYTGWDNHLYEYVWNGTNLTNQDLGQQ